MGNLEMGIAKLEALAAMPDPTPEAMELMQDGMMLVAEDVKEQLIKMLARYDDTPAFPIALVAIRVTAQALIDAMRREHGDEGIDVLEESIGAIAVRREQK